MTRTRLTAKGTDTKAPPLKDPFAAALYRMLDDILNRATEEGEIRLIHRIFSV